MTKLTSFLKDNGLTNRAFAAKVGVDPSIISRLTRDDMTPSLELAAAIEIVTGGFVPAVSWVSDAAHGRVNVHHVHQDVNGPSIIQGDTA